MRTLDAFGKCILAGGAALALSAPLDTAHAKGFSVLYSFTGGSDGVEPYAGMLMDKAGNLFGTTEQGGTHDDGVVFKLAPDGTERVLYSFAGGSDGADPVAGLIGDNAGNLYGTTTAGGGASCACGTVFKLASDGTETVLHSFAGGSDGRYPEAGLLTDKAGNLYGTTYGGGTADVGVVFKLAPDGTETVFYTFGTSGGDGETPVAGLIKDAAGNLYGTTAFGGSGCFDSGCGVVFKLAPDGIETVLYSFCSQTNCSDGLYPQASLIKDAAGNLYGMTPYGGTQNDGAVFKLAPDGTETVLYSFVGGSDGISPRAGLIKDAAGNLYGTTYAGGVKNAGTVFKLAPDGTETVLHSFSRRAHPLAALIADRKGHLYGTTSMGGASHYGTVFKLKE